jgi:uncharacterized membrane protein YeaQ/YmgE (transglycosylase-associated protein family)
MLIPLIFLILFLIFVFGIWITVSLIGVLITLAVAAFIGWLAMKIVPGKKMPYGWLGAIVAGLLGSWIGGVILGHAGPDIGGIAVAPALVGAVIVIFLFEMWSKSGRGGARGW